ncbi:MAG TPA: hypothetical protein VKX39_06750 [Bryobacteraceae bacterium]|jgi:hypothetical protein|nr:hypothetical protein [Bryobacteraceae bacterium]
MFSLRRAAAAIRVAAVASIPLVTAWGQPALTTIQDILYRADGTRFNGTLYINYEAFQAGDASNIATANLTVPIVNGVLNVQLVPTTTASAGAQYNVTFNSNGINQFTQIWAVPPSAVPLTVRSVLVSQGSVVGPPPVTTQINISDVNGLQNQLAIRPQAGVSFTPGRAAVIDSSGQIDGAAGNLTDCVRVDGSSGPCGAGGSGVFPSFSDEETPAGAVNGANTIFTLAFAPSPAASLLLYVNGLLMKQGIDYTINGNTVTFLASSIPQSGDVMTASYRYANPSNPLGTLTAAQVVCSSAGSGTSAASLVQLGSCTIPAGLLGAGDRIEVEYRYSHTGTSAGFTGAILWAGTNLVSRTAGAAETAFAGRIMIGINAGAQSWDAESWGNNLSFTASSGNASAAIGQNLTISFQADLAAATTDTISLTNFTVIRYPAQSNP